MAGQSRGLGSKALVVLALGAAQSAAYLLCNRHPFTLPRELPLTSLDVAIPFWPWTIGGYLLLLVLAPLLPLFVRDRDVFRRLVIAWGLGMAATVAFLAFLPTTYPRPPLPVDASWSSAAYRWFVAIDRPDCCFPSAHVLTPALGAYALWRDRRRSAPLVALFVALLVPSTLTTKQHYVLDVAGAVVLGALAIGVTELVCNARRRDVRDRTRA